MLTQTLTLDSVGVGSEALARACWEAVERLPKPKARRQTARAVEVPLVGEWDCDDATWIARVQQGDEAAASALVERLYPTVIKVVRSHLPRRTSEEDLVQAVFMKVFKKLHQFSGLVLLEHWVSRITINTCFNQLRHETSRRELRLADLTEEEEAVVQRLASTDQDLPGNASHAARELVEKLLARLNAEERLIVTLLHLEGRSTGEISRMTGRSVTSIKVKAFRARHKMRSYWEAMLKEQGW